MANRDFTALSAEEIIDRNTVSGNSTLGDFVPTFDATSNDTKMKTVGIFL